MRQLRRSLFVFILEQFFARDLLLGHVSELEDEIDDLVLVNRRAELSERIDVVAIVVPDFLLATGHLTRALDDRTTDLVIGDGDLVLFTNLRQHETKPDAPVGDLAIFVLGGLFRRALVGEGLAAGLHLGPDRIPHQPELFLDQRWRRLKTMSLIETVEQDTLDALTGSSSEFGIQPL